MSYAELLRDPRWQRRRLEILSASDFSCSACCAKDRTLNVHHKRYRNGAKPWEYEDHELESLCEPCHQARHKTGKRLKEATFQMGNRNLRIVLGYAEAMNCFDDGIPVDLIDEDHVTGIAAWFHGHGHIKDRLMEMLARGEKLTPKIVDELIESMVYGRGKN